MKRDDLGEAIVPRLVYPSSDGEPMADNDANRSRMIDTWSALQEAFLRRGVVAYASGDLFVYPVEGEPWTRRAPDVIVAPGCKQAQRGSFKYWEEPGRVEFCGEFLSPLKKLRLDSDEVQEDLEFYRTRLKTREVFIYEPLGLKVTAGFQFHFRRLKGSRYRAVRPGRGRWYASEVLGLDIRPNNDRVEVRDPETGEVYLPSRIRAEREARRAERAEREVERLAAAQREAEERNAALEREIARLQGKGG